MAIHAIGLCAERSLGPLDFLVHRRGYLRRPYVRGDDPRVMVEYDRGQSRQRRRRTAPPRGAGDVRRAGQLSTWHRRQRISAAAGAIPTTASPRPSARWCSRAASPGSWRRASASMRYHPAPDRLHPVALIPGQSRWRRVMSMTSRCAGWVYRALSPRRSHSSSARLRAHIRAARRSMSICRHLYRGMKRARMALAHAGNAGEGRLQNRRCHRGSAQRMLKQWNEMTAADFAGPIDQGVHSAGRRDGTARPPSSHGHRHSS